MNITVNTKLYAVIGDPIAQSLSPQLHNGLFKENQIDALYLPVGVKSENLEKLMDGFRLLNFGGFNITKPHKMDIMKYLDEIDTLAQKIGAVNTVVCQDGKMIGYNTDGFGFIKSIEKKLGIIEKENLSILILGCGGAVKSVAMALADWGVREVIITNRTLEKAVDLAAQINETWPGKARAIPMEESGLREVIENVGVIVNGTSLGMADHPERTPISKTLIKKGILVYDMIYSPPKTQLLKDAQDSGAEIENGLEMLLYQGLLAFELWTGIFPDPEQGKALLIKGIE